MYYVYIIRSLSRKIYYKGVTEDFTRRLEQHNNGQSRFTSNATPWELVYVELHHSKHDALVREKKLKKSKTAYIEWLISQPSNIIKK